MHCKGQSNQERGYPLHTESIGCIHNLSANSEFTGRRNAGWPEQSAFLGSFPEIPTGFTGIPGSKLFKQVLSAPEHYCELPALEEVALAEMQSPQCSLTKSLLQGLKILSLLAPWHLTQLLPAG